MITKGMKALGLTLGLSLGFVGVLGLPALGERVIPKTVSTGVVRPINANTEVSEPQLGVIGGGRSRVIRPARPQSLQKRPSRPISVIENPEPVLGRFVNVPFVDARDRFSMDQYLPPFVNGMRVPPIKPTKNWKEVSRNSSGSLFYSGSVFYLDGNSVGNRVNDFIALSMSFPTGGYALRIKKLERDLLNPQNFVLYYCVNTPDGLVTTAIENLADVIAIQRPSGLIGSPSIEPRLVETIALCRS